MLVRSSPGRSFPVKPCCQQPPIALYHLSPLSELHGALPLALCPARWPQGEELEPARAKAEKMGVKQIFIDDLREEFVRDYVFPMFRYG